MTNQLRVVAARDEDLKHVAAHLRPEDVGDLRGAGIQDALPHFRSATLTGRCWAVVPKGNPAVAVGGIVPQDDGVTGLVWMMGTPDLASYWREFVRRVPAYLDALHEVRPLLHNLSRKSNSKHRRWLQWAGFTLLPTEKVLPPFNETYQELVRIRPCQSQH